MSQTWSDAELESKLRRFRPAGPPSSLRAHIVDSKPAPRVWPWAAAAAAALLLASVFRVATTRTLATAHATTSPDPWAQLDEVVVRQLADAPGRERLASILVDSARSRLEAASVESARQGVSTP